MQEGEVSKIATAHTMDDQAETVLLRMLRGTGIRGLSGIHPRIVFDQGEVVRPLLGFHRAELEAFLRERGQSWREDSSNRDLAFLRNRVRHRLLPLIKEDFGASAVENLADLAEIARAEEEHWERTQQDMRAFGFDSKDTTAPLPLQPGLRSLPLAARRRFVRGWLESSVAGISISFRLIEEVLDLARGPAGKKLELPGGKWLRRTQHELRLEPAIDGEPRDYEYSLSIPGVVEVPELSVLVEAVLLKPETVPQEDRESLLDLTHLPRELVVRNWRPGDRFWPAHAREEKKVKELLADRHLTGVQKKLWPVAVAPDLGLIWMREFPAPASLRPTDPQESAVWIRVTKQN
jgi:tRNA(Ile)-lysidine synthase